MKKLFIGILVCSLGVTACEKLDQRPQSTASKEAVFSTESGLKLYTNSFYGMDFLPRNSIRLDELSDYLAVKQVDNFIREGGYGANTSSGWTWTDQNPYK